MSAHRKNRKRGFAIAAILMMTALCVTTLPLGVTNARAQSSFYQASPNEVAGAPGTLIRQEPLLQPAPFGASAYRMLYRSTGLNNESIPVSGVIVVPAGPAPANGRPIVAWAHPTTGVVPRCAPSLALFVFQQIQGLREMIGRGYVVAATDYPGLGTPQTHPYLVGVSEARAVLDSVRAARALTGTQNRFAVWGHSQGGQAALFTGLLAKSYAPELNLAGIAAAAPATELGTLLDDDINSTGGRNLLSMTLWSWARVFGAPIDRVVDPAAIPTINLLADECIEFDLRFAAPAQHGASARAEISLGEQSSDDRALAFAARRQHARRIAAEHSSIPCAGRCRRAGAAAGDPGLHEAPVRGRQQSTDGGFAGCKSRLHCAR